ncbi:MAG: amino acid permease [Candidatus Omnitrophica bacterium]|nr:amino acid permease [Candidatus Omnitrophota bacterium]
MGHVRTAGTLKRSLTLTDATALVVGCTIGAGIFRMAAPIAGRIHQVGLVMAVWVIGGITSFCGALCYAELAAAYPKTGGDYIYLTRAYGPAVGFLFGWTKIFTERIGTIAILGFVFAEYLGFLLPYGPLGTKAVASGAIVGLTAANVIGVHVGKGVQNFLTSLKILALASIIGMGMISGKGQAASPQPFWPAQLDLGILQAMGVALVFVLWTYGGWAESTYVVEEVKHPERTLPWSILWGLTIVTGLYLMVNWVYLIYIPLSEMGKHPLVAAEVMRAVWGPVGGTVTAGMVACSAFGALNGFIMTSSRILMAVGRDHSLFSRLAHVDDRFSTPAKALIFNAAGALLLVWMGTFEQIVTYSTVVISLFFAMAAFSVILLRRRDPGTPRPYRVWGYPATPPPRREEATGRCGGVPSAHGPQLTAHGRFH